MVWRSPWRRLLDDLARDLPALAAFLGLRLRELLRRNFSGELSVPAFWPQELIVWFWPLLLLLIVGVLLLPPVLLLRHGPAPAEPPPAPLELPLDPLPAPGSAPAAPRNQWFQLRPPQRPHHRWIRCCSCSRRRRMPTC